MKPLFCLYRMPFTTTESHVHQLLSSNSGFLSTYHDQPLVWGTDVALLKQPLEIGTEYTGAAVRSDVSREVTRERV